MQKWLSNWRYWRIEEECQWEVHKLHQEKFRKELGEGHCMVKGCGSELVGHSEATSDFFKDGIH